MDSTKMPAVVLFAHAPTQENASTAQRRFPMMVAKNASVSVDNGHAPRVSVRNALCSYATWNVQKVMPLALMAAPSAHAIKNPFVKKGTKKKLKMAVTPAYAQVDNGHAQKKHA